MKKTRKKKKKLKIGSTWRLLMLVGLVILLMLLIVYITLSRAKREQAYQTSDLLIDQIENVIHGNERKEQSLTDSLKESYISKAKAVAFIIDNIPETEYNLEELKRIAKLMSIDEIHLFTAEGEIYSGTVPKYYGYTFDSGDQMAYFKPMLEDKNLSMCQDVTPNTAESKPMMYAICWNDSGTRIIQAGIEPKRLIEEMQSNEISQVVANIPAYEGVDILVANLETKKIMGATETEFISKDLSDIGLNEDAEAGGTVTHFTANVDGKKSYCAMRGMDNYIIAIAQEKAKVLADIPFTLFLIFVYLMLAAITLAIVVKRMTDRRERIQAISERAIAASQAKTSFLSNMSHEIRTPINAILGMNEMIMRESDETDTDIRMYSQSIKTAGNTLLGLVNDILDFSKIEEGKLEIIPVDYDLSATLNDLVNMIKTRLDDKGLYLKLDFDKNMPRMLHGDEIRIKQIITNILTNAAKYTEAGSVTFSMSYERLKDDLGTILLKVSVRDTGIGIRQEDIEKLFSRFERIEEKRNRSIEGTGLGMNITQMLLDMMGSTLEVESEYGVGSTFSFSIRQRVVKWEPLGDYEETWRQSIKEMSAYKEKLVAPDAEILVVDDNSLNIMVFTSLLKQTRIKIDKASSGNEAINYAMNKHYDIIFLDHMMPEKDGIETLHEIKENPINSNPDTPYICLTANAISGAREEYIKEGFDDYLTKPIIFNELENMLIKYLPESKILKEREDEGETEESETAQEIPESFRELNNAGINVSVGIEYSGDVEAYRSVLESFYTSFDSKKEEIEAYYQKEDIENYTIKVHALKSAARIIGATEFGEEAQMLEDAGKRRDLDYINKHHEDVFAKYDALKQPIENALGVKEETQSGEAAGELIDGSLLTELYEKLRDAAKDDDFLGLEQTMEKLKAYRIPEGEQERFHALEKAVDELEYEEILNLLAE